MVTLSIIVPVYSVEKYIRECINSILSQSFEDYELILIDDGSPDNCGIICDFYKKQDSRIKVIHQVNKGVSAARNVGLMEAEGKYIGFVDADDWIHPDMYKTLIMTANCYSVDLVACSYSSDSVPETTKENNGQIWNNDNLIRDLFSKPSTFKGSCCNKIIRRELAIKHKFREDVKIWEDLMYLQDIYLKENLSGFMVYKKLYHYRANTSSATNISLPSYGNLQFKNYIFNELNKYSIQYVSLALDYFLDSSLYLLNIYKQSNNNGKIKAIINIKVTILYWLLISIKLKLLKPEKLHRYLYEGVIKI